VMCKKCSSGYKLMENGVCKKACDKCLTKNGNWNGKVCASCQKGQYCESSKKICMKITKSVDKCESYLPVSLVKKTQGRRNLQAQSGSRIASQCVKCIAGHSSVKNRTECVPSCKEDQCSSDFFCLKEFPKWLGGCVP
jgi:hypothetical protein